MKFKTTLCVSIFMIFNLTIGCSSHKINNVNEPNTQVNQNQEAISVNITKVIEEYFDAMKNHNISNIGNLFMKRLSTKPEDFNFNYVNDVSINKIKEADYNDASVNMYKNFIIKEYTLEEDKVRIFEVVFTIKVEEGFDNELGGENIQKFALVKENNKWLICEMFR
ncbi:MAG: DUF4829 domain-containing protein [Clostridium sp.]